MVVSFITYGFFGVLGFLIDFSIFNILFAFTEIHIFSRFASYLCATIVTWSLNTRFTFRYDGDDKFKFRSFLRYFLSQFPSIIINITAHISIILFFGFSTQIVIVIFIINGFTALIINFLLSKFYVFKT